MIEFPVGVVDARGTLPVALHFHPPPVTVTFQLGDAIAKLLKLQGLTQKDLADRARLRASTVSDLINDAVMPEQQTIERVLDVLGTTRASVEALVEQMNGRRQPAAPELSRASVERDDDRDPNRVEALQYARRILALPSLARMAVYNVIAAFEDAAGSPARKP